MSKARVEFSMMPQAGNPPSPYAKSGVAVILAHSPIFIVSTP